MYDGSFLKKKKKRYFDSLATIRHYSGFPLTNSLERNAIIVALFYTLAAFRYSLLENL